MAVVGGKAHHFVADDFSGSDGRKVFLSDVESGAEQASEIGSVVQHEENARAVTEVRNAFGIIEICLRPVVFVPVLQNARSAIDECLCRRVGQTPAIREESGIEYGVEARKLKRDRHAWSGRLPWEPERESVW